MTALTSSRAPGRGDVAQRIEIETGDYKARWNYGAFSLDQGFSREGVFPGVVRREEIDVIPLDDDAGLRRLDRLDLIKIDAEGMSHA